MTERDLRRNLERAAASFHRSPERLSHDELLFATLLALYDEPADTWDGKIKPFLARSSAGLDNIYGEHAAAPVTRTMDHPEFLLILERAENDGLRLERSWPLDRRELQLISDIWGIPVAD